MINKILLVGGTGYLGRHLEDLLKRSGFEVHITGTKANNKPNYYQISFEKEETFNTISKAKFDLVILLASRLNALGTVELNHPDLKTNSICYASFLGHLAKQKITKKIIYISSMTVYGMANHLPVEEDGVINPVNVYGLSKYLAEEITSFYCNNNEAQGVILRLPGIFGGDRKAGYVYSIAKKCKANEQIILKSQGLIFWESIYIDDLCGMVLRFLKAYEWGKNIDIFNIGYGEEIDFYSVAYLVKSLLKSSSVFEIDGKKDYIPFYMSNKKIKNLISGDEKFDVSLKKYLFSS